jgi:hypothetical protein
MDFEDVGADLVDLIVNGNHGLPLTPVQRNIATRHALSEIRCKVLVLENILRYLQDALREERLGEAVATQASNFAYHIENTLLGVACWRRRDGNGLSTLGRCLARLEDELLDIYEREDDSDDYFMRRLYASMREAGRLAYEM